MELKKRGLEAMLEGELVPQNPDDEPAGVLPERIQDEWEVLEMPIKSEPSRIRHD